MWAPFCDTYAPNAESAKDGKYKVKKGFCLANEKNSFNLCVAPGQLVDVVKDGGLYRVNFYGTLIELIITKSSFDKYVKSFLGQE